MTDDASKLKPRGAFYGRRKGHALRKGQARLMSDVLPELALDLTKPAPNDLRSLFKGGAEVRLEIGFGGGEHLLHEAKRHPEIGYLGCDVYINGVAKLLAVIRAEGAGNIRLHHGDAEPLLDWLPEQSLQRIDILYPDPWPKRRHWKRRFMQDDSLAALARILKPGGELRFATDIPSYAEWGLARFLRSPHFAWTAECADDWRKPWPDFPGTRYEAKAFREGRIPCYLTFRRL
jgi:tRNA (guanine-N7-)-methyltransferase